MTTWRDADSDAVGIFWNIARWCVWQRLVLRFIQLETNLREIIQFRNCRTFDLRFDTALQYTVEQRIYVGFFGEVEEGFCIV